MITQTWQTIRSLAFISAVSQLHLSQRAAALLNKEWRQSRWIHPYELSDTNKVLIVDESEVMDIVDGYGGYGCQASRGLSSEQPADYHSRRRKHRWTGTMRLSSAGTALIFLLIQGASRACTGTVQHLLFYTPLYAFKHLPDLSSSSIYKVIYQII